MRCIPYGYRIEDGRVIINEEEAQKVHAVFDEYAAGCSMADIRRKLMIEQFHTGISNILKDKRYQGTDFYPEIIDKKLFDMVQKVRVERRRQHSRPTHPRKAVKVQVEFTMQPIEQNLTDPFAQAQYIYHQIIARE
jgi:hypothetical protein